MPSKRPPPPGSSADAIHRMAMSIVRMAPTVDPSTKLPVVVIDSTKFPASSATTKSDIYPRLVPAVLELLPPSDYVALVFAGGALQKPSWSWAAKTYKMLDRGSKKRVRKIYVVHESWWVRAVSEMLNGVVSAKFKRKIVHVATLTQLAQLIDITLIDIKPLVYLHDLKLEDSITVPRHPTPVFSAPLRVSSTAPRLPQLCTDTIDHLRLHLPTAQDPFRKPSEVESQLIPVLRDCYDRDQLVDLVDYGPHVVLGLLKAYLYLLPDPVLPTSSIHLPVQEALQYSQRTFDELPLASRVLLTHLMDQLLAPLVNHFHVPASSIAQFFGPCLAGCYASSKEQVAIAVRVLRNMLESWSELEITRVPLVRSTAPHRPSQPLHNPKIRHSSTPDNWMALTEQEPVLTELEPTARSTSSSASLPSAPVTAPVAASLSLPSAPKSTSASASESTKTPKPEPPAPRKQTRKPSGVVKPAGPLQPSTKLNIAKHPVRVKHIKPPVEAPVELPPRRFGPRSKMVSLNRKGKMVAELAKLYEERSSAADVLASIVTDS